MNLCGLGAFSFGKLSMLIIYSVSLIDIGLVRLSLLSEKPGRISYPP